jgi:PAS domain S-box-containing protein
MPSSQYHFALIDTIPLACLFFDNEFKILHVNALCSKMLNVSLTSISNKFVTVLFPEINLCIKNEGKNSKTIFIDENLNSMEVIVRYASIENEPFGILYVIEEFNLSQNTIDKQKIDEIIADNIPYEIAIYDTNHNYLFVNSNGIRNDETREWVIGKNDFDYCNYKGLDKSFAQNRWDLFNKAIQTKKQVEWIDEYHKESKDIYIMRRLYPFFIDNTFAYMIGYGIDVTELKKTQNKIVSNEIRNQLILNSALDAVIIISPDDEITFWNPQAEIIFGWKSEEVLGKKLVDVIIPERYRKRHTHGKKKHNNGFGGATANKIIEFPALNKFKGEIPIEFSILPIYDKGIIINYCSFMRDISIRKNKEFEIIQQNKILENQNSELEQFTYITSHDLQEPLLTLMSFSDLLIEEYSDSLDDEAKLYIEFINKSAGRMRALVTGLMEYARIGKRDEVKEIDCNLVINDILLDLSVKIKNTKTNIIVENLPKIRGYETYIRLLFQNLISNAIKFNKEGTKSEIKIECLETDKEWDFSIADNGIGISEKYINQVFIIFKRLNNDSLYKGYGIGLAHCKKIVDIHHGEIKVKSKLGLGSTFSFTISKNI